MAKVFSLPYTDTPISGVTSNTTLVGLVNYAADWRVEEKGDDYVLLTNLRAPIGYAERFRLSWSDPNTLYKGTGIEPSMRSQSTRMVSILIQHECVAIITDSADATFQNDVPCRTNITVKLPMIGEMTGAIALGLIQRNLAGIFETGVNTATRLDALLRGSLVPADMK